MPSCLIATWDATGPSGIVCVVTRAPVLSFTGSRSGTVTGPLNVWGTPCETSRSEMMRQRGSRIMMLRISSTQKLPMVVADLRENARMSATSTAIPPAAERKFWTASPAIWVK